MIDSHISNGEFDRQMNLLTYYWDFSGNDKLPKIPTFLFAIAVSIIS